MRKHASRRQEDILHVLNGCEKPMTAYEIMNKLKTKDSDIAPPTVYRALSALTKQGRAHRLESLKAFVPCRCAHSESAPIFAVCDDCGFIEEHDGSRLVPEIRDIAGQSGFHTTRHIVELHGTCQTCAA